MVIVHLFVGVSASLLALVVSLATGHPGRSALVAFVVGGNAGLLCSAAVAGLSGAIRPLSSRPRGVRQAGVLVVFVLGFLALGWTFVR